MPLPLAQVRVGQSLRYRSLTVFPLFCQDQRPVDYLLSDEALEAGTAIVNEVSQQGSVPDLIVENTGSERVLFLEGQELRGAKQNRILNASFLLPANCKLMIPVSCVEQGRWRRTSASFSSSGTASPYRLRQKLRGSVSRSLKEKRGHRSDQGQVWEEVRSQQDALGVSSSTAALADTYEKYGDLLAEARKALGYVEGSSGLAVAIGSKLVSADVFDKPATCKKLWDRLLSGVVLDALCQGEQVGSPDAAQVDALLLDARNADWTQTEPIGEGQEYRAEYDSKLGSALVLDGALVHGSVLASVE